MEQDHRHREALLNFLELSGAADQVFAIWRRSYVMGTDVKAEHVGHAKGRVFEAGVQFIL
jgi:hypothetical protein